MEEFEHMTVEEFNEEDFYETIEAPKFVDLTAPDHRPEGDDRYWFCSRVGCDQKHEEFMDSEVIYKNFVLRVMAARSPSVRLRKALYRKDSSVAPKCPNTVPAKPSRSRVSKLAMISSIPLKTNGNIKSKEVKLVSSTNKKSSVISSVPKKALTEKRKQMQSPAAFRSAQNTRTATVKLSENKVVAKALVFHSPKKLVKLKRSVELSSSVKKLCNGMRKLDIENKRKSLVGVNHKVPCKRPLERREVKSRVFNSVRSQKQTKEKAKQKVKEKKKLEVSSDLSKAHEVNLMELENQSLSSLETLKTNMDNQLQASEDPDVIKKSGLDKEKQYRTPVIEDNENALVLECENKENASNAADVNRGDVAVTKESGLDREKRYETVVECDDKENATDAVDIDRDNDDKENSATLDNNRKMDQATYPLLKKKVFGKKETCKTTQKAMATADKCFNGKTVSANTRIKYTKPKLTNPKPFRLRTDERRILKEANIEKKPESSLVREEETTNIHGLHVENLGPKHQTVRLEKNTTSSRLKAYKGKSTTLVSRQDGSENMVNGKRIALGTKKQVASKRNETTEKSKEVAIINKSSVASGDKRHATVPKGPNFHSIHVPKSCTKRVASQV